MTHQSTDSGRAVPLALAEPTVHVRSGWIAGLSLGSLGMWMASLTPIQVILPLQLQNIDNAHKIADLAIVSGVGAVASVIATPLAGALSDRTTHAYGFGGLRGRRHRWTLIMALLAAISMLFLAHQKTVAGVAVLWVLFSAFQNGEYASLSAAIPDHVPVRQRATVAGWVGMPQALGLVAGTILVVLVFSNKIVISYYVIGLLMFLLVIPFIFLTSDHPLEPENREPFSWRRLARPTGSARGSTRTSPGPGSPGSWPPWRSRWARSTCCTSCATRCTTASFPGQTASDGLLILILIYTVCVVLTAIVGGVISDRIGKRKMIVTVSGALMGLAALLLTFVETWQASLVAAVLFGVGFGAYLAVDQALITQVLPAAADRAKDLGIINIAIVGPAAIGAAIAGPLVTIGGYPTLFAGTAVVAALGSIFVWRIKGVP